MANKPDFIVDPSGNVQDVRHLKYTRESASPPPRKPKARSSKPRTSAPTTYSRRVQKSGQSPGIIIIPIGFILTIIFALSAANRPGQPPPPDATIPILTRNALESGERQYAAGDYDLALASFNRAIERDPNWGAAYHARGLVHVAIGENDEAIADFNETIKLLPGVYVSYINRGSLYLAKGKYDQAILDFTKAIRLNDEYPVSFYNPEDGFRYSSDADFALVYANRGHAFFYTGKYAEAIVDLEKALEMGLDPIDETLVKAILDDLQ